MKKLNNLSKKIIVCIIGGILLNAVVVTAITTITTLRSLIGVVPTFTDTIDTSLPAGADDPSEADDNMRRIQAGFQEIGNVEHDYSLTGTEITGDGTHTAITCDSVTSAGAISGTDIDATGNVTMATAKTLTVENIAAVDATGINFKDKDGVKFLDLADGGAIDVSASSIVEETLDGTADMLASSAAIKTYVDGITDPAYAGGQSHTFNGGLILKMGTVAAQGSGDVVDWNPDFPTAVISATAIVDNANANVTASIDIVGAGSMKVYHAGGATEKIWWIAVGH